MASFQELRHVLVLCNAVVICHLPGSGEQGGQAALKAADTQDMLHNRLCYCQQGWVPRW